MRRSYTSPAVFPRPSPGVLRDFGDRGVQWLLTTYALVISLLALLHARLAGDLDYDTCERAPRTAFPSDLRKAENDALYLIHFLPQVVYPGPRTPLLVLLEHKGSAAYYTPLQEHQYITTHWLGGRQRDLPPGVTPREWLSAAVVIRFHTGRDPWSTPRTLAGLIAAPDYLLPSGSLGLELELDLGRFATQRLRDLASPIGWALVLMQAEWAEAPDHAVALQEVMAGLTVTVVPDPDDTWLVVWYVVLHLFHRRSAAEYDEWAPRVFDWARSIFPEAQLEVDQMTHTMADVIRERGVEIGEQRGIQIGEQRGIQVGRQEGILWMQDLVLDGVRARFHDAGPLAEARVREMRTLEMLQQAQRALVASASAEEFLARLAAGQNGGATAAG